MSSPEKELVDAISKLTVQEHDDSDSIAHPVFDRVFPSLEPLTTDPTFIEEEHNSAIALLNNQFFETEHKKDAFKSMYERAEKWFEGTKTTKEELDAIEKSYKEAVTKLIAKEDAQFDRIFLRDADRAFNTPKRKTALCHILTYLQSTTLKSDYHQGLSMMVSFLHCFLPAPKVIAMAIHANERLLPGVWKSRSDACVVDGYVIYALLEQHKPALHKHLLAQYIIPEMFTSKFWCATSVHLLPFQSLVCLYDEFWGDAGVLALFELVFLTILGQEEAILKAASTDKTLELVSLDPSVLSCAEVNRLTYHYPDETPAVNPSKTGNSDTPETPQDHQLPEDDSKASGKTLPGYVLNARSLVEPLREKTKLEELRTTAFTTHILPRIARTEQDFAKPTDPDCSRESCEDPKETGFYYCLDCKVHLCENCAYSSWDAHNDDDHEIRINEDLDEE